MKFLKFISNDQVNILPVSNIARICDLAGDDKDYKSKIFLKEPIVEGSFSTVAIYTDESADQLFTKLL